MMEIRQINSDRDDVKQVLALSDDYMGALYPPESNHLEPVDALQKSNVGFFGVFIEGQLAGTGAVKIMNDDGMYGEIKRVYVKDAYRGKGVSRLIMNTLHEYLTLNEVQLARLEVGYLQPEALGLYRNLGYQDRGPFGQYTQDPNSIFMERRL